MFLLVILGLSHAVLGSPEVATSRGKVAGHTLLSRDGRMFYAFDGIPYARPPVGDLRFQPPQPALPWKGVLLANQSSPICYQPNFLKSQGGMQGQEDCLYLSVYSPKLNGSYPVMVHTHGGGFIYGRGIKPSFFMDEDVVLVIVGYRLGYLGFLSFEDEVLPGNYGIKDQLMAIEWVKEEIHNFGGSPDLITALGMSAGGALSHYICSTPRGRALLKGCISQSGVGGSIWSLHAKGDGSQMAADFAMKNGCNLNKTSETLKCLKNLPIEKFKYSLDIRHPTYYIAPVIEEPSETSVIAQWPSNSSDFPWITGFMAHEALVITEYFKDFAPKVEKIGLYIGGDIILAEILHLRNSHLWELFEIKKRFFKLKNIFDPLDDYERFLTEFLWIYPALKSLKNHNGPKYFYRFSYTGGPSIWEQHSNKTLNLTGACHGDDYAYFYDLSDFFQPKGWPGPQDIQLSKNLIKMWVHFAKYQNPSIMGIPWDQFGNEANYLDITNEGLSMKKFPGHKDILNFWSSLDLPLEWSTRIVL